MDQYILYLDTSSLVKLYLDEARSTWVREWAEASYRIATSRLAYVEALSAFARRHAEGDLDTEDFSLILRSFRSEWLDFVILDLDENAQERAGTFALQHLLRGSDAIHLAAAARLHELLPSETLLFSSFDGKLNQAAQREGLRPLPDGSS